MQASQTVVDPWNVIMILQWRHNESDGVWVCMPSASIYKKFKIHIAKCRDTQFYSIINFSKHQTKNAKMDIHLLLFEHHTLQWRHYDGVSNHQPHDCLLNRLFRRRSKKTSKLRITGLCAGNLPMTGEFPAHIDNVIMKLRWIST